MKLYAAAMFVSLVFVLSVWLYATVCVKQKFCIRYMDKSVKKLQPKIVSMSIELYLKNSNI